MASHRPAEPRRKCSGSVGSPSVPYGGEGGRAWDADLRRRGLSTQAPVYCSPAILACFEKGMEGLHCSPDNSRAQLLRPLQVPLRVKQLW